MHATLFTRIIEGKLPGRFRWRDQLEADTKPVGGVRLLPGRFMVINQAMASQKGCDAGAAYVQGFIEEMKSSGFVAKAFARYGIEGAPVAPAGDGR
jgi:polar amino acid transport system substrate-binding protein